MKVVVGVLIALGVALAVVWSGGFSAQSVVIDRGEEPPGPVVSVPTVLVSVPFSSNSTTLKGVAPAHYEFTAKRGLTLDSWTGYGYFRIADVSVPYEPKEKLVLVVYNRHNFPLTFTFEYEDVPESSFSRATRKWYDPAPSDAEGWVKLPGPVTVEPMSVMKVPWSIRLPRGVSYPAQWEFRILVHDSIEGMAVTSHAIRVFVTMVR